MEHGGLQNLDNTREALLVRLAKELDIKPATFLKCDHEFRRAITRSRIAAISLSAPLSPEQESRMREIFIAGIDAGILKDEDKEELLN
jgi:hypothetical protein